MREQGRRCSASSSPANHIPLEVLQQSFAQHSSAESSHLSSSQSPSTTPPSSAGPSEHAPSPGIWPSLANGNPYPSPSTTTQPSQSPPPTETSAANAAARLDPRPVSQEDHGNQATPPSQQQDSRFAPRTRIRGWVSDRSWFQSMLGIASLAMTMISLFVYGLRSYEMAKWSERNDLLQMCAGLIQANVTGGPNCERVLREGPTLPPYSKRAVIYNPGAGAYRFTKRTTSFTEHVARVDWMAHTVADYGFGGIGYWALAALSAVTMVCGMLALLRSRPSDNEVFTSLVRMESNGRVTRHYTEEPKTIEHEGPPQIIKRNPPQDQDPGELRRRIIQDRTREGDGAPHVEGELPWDTYFNNSSEGTLVAAWTESNSRNVSIATTSDEKLHEGLVELTPTGDTGDVLDPHGDASYHVSPWKSTHSGADYDSISLKSKPKVEGTVKRAIVAMGAGGGALANGKVIENHLVEILKKKVRVPQQPGDCLAGEVTNEPPT